MKAFEYVGLVVDTHHHLTCKPTRLHANSVVQTDDDQPEAACACTPVDEAADEVDEECLVDVVLFDEQVEVCSHQIRHHLPQEDDAVRRRRRVGMFALQTFGISKRGRQDVSASSHPN